MTQNELYHHGVLGMKWGVRRYQDEHGKLTTAGKKKYDRNMSEINMLKKGSTIYRTTANKDESTVGNKYITSFKSDRNFYRGQGASWIANTNNTNNLYEKQYKTTKNLKIATAKDVENSINRLSEKNKNFNEKANKAYADFLGSNIGVREDKMIDLYYKRAKSGKRFVESKDIHKTLNQIYKKEYADLSKNERDNLIGRYQEAGRKYIYQYERAKTIINDSSNPAASTLYRTAGFGTKEGSKLKNQVIDDLKRQGYDGMSDIAGMGGAKGYKRETRQAMIVFDTDKNLKNKSTKKLSYSKHAKAVKKYRKWKQKIEPYSSLHY